MKEKIYCRTNKERDEVLKRLEEKDYRWMSGGEPPTKFKGTFNAPMTLHIENNEILQSSGIDKLTEWEAEKWLKENLKYKKGDLFQIKPNLADLPDGWSGINDSMIKLAGDLVTLDRISYGGNLEFNENGWTWSEKWVNPIKEVERCAEPGEFVKVVNANGAVINEYKNGDILKIIDRGGTYYKAYYKDGDGKFLFSHEYVVLEGYEDCDQVKKFEEPLLNTKICIIRGDENFTTGKIYEVVNGKIVADDKWPCGTTVLKNIGDLKEYFSSDEDRTKTNFTFPHYSYEGIEFIEVVE